ncbi:MAG TPA: TonB-dependent receptor [Rhizomicrobium sp.]|nr:TonB-dependent receptor [Rhizomicrobium sp.]
MLRNRFKFALLIGTSLSLPIAADAAPSSDSDTAPSSDSDVTVAGLAASAPEQVPEQVIVTARRREEAAQDVPIALSVVPAAMLEATGAYDVSLITQLTPTMQFYSSNPRNTALTIRGLGTSFGLTNDGLESGVGLYVDQVYMSRPAAATFDFVDVDQVEILRGPQGTLFGKNTTAGAVNISIRKPSFEPEFTAELSGGDYGFAQGKASISGPLAGEVLAARFSVEGTLRGGMVYDVTTNQQLNNENNFATRLQLLYRPNEHFDLRLSADYNEEHEACCALSFVGVGATLKSANRQFPALAKSFGYAPASLDPFERLVDENSLTQAHQVLGGVSAIANWDLGDVTLTSVSAWRTWNWDPASDRDFTRLSIQTVSANPDNQNQYSEELRVASNGKQTVDYVAGLYTFWQTIDGSPVAAYGPDATNWLLAGTGSPSNLLNGYEANSIAHSNTQSYAIFAQATWNATDALHVTPGLRYTFEDKSGSFSQTVSGGNPRTDTAAHHSADIGNLNSIARDQSYSAQFTNGSPSGQLNVSYDLGRDSLVYATYAQGFKSGGINLAGIPVDSAGNPVVRTAVIKPENVTSYEAGLKNQFFNRMVTFDVDVFDEEVKNYQVNVVDSGPGALRGYLSNIPRVRSRGFEWDSTFIIDDGLTGYFNGAWTDGEYVHFANGPCPLELTGNSTSFCNLSGRPLPGLSRWALSGGGEYRRDLPSLDAMGYIGADISYRSSAYSDASDSQYLIIKGYPLVNARAGLTFDNWDAFFWVRNVFDRHYFTYLQPQTGNSGMIVGLVGDPCTFGVTLRLRR